MSAIQGILLWQHTRRLARRHPFFARKGALLSRREAEALLRDVSIPDGRTVLQQARIELGIPEPVPTASARSTAHFSVRRWGVALALLVLVGGFFTLTEHGTAMWQQMYGYVVRLFDGHLKGYGTVPEDVPPIDFDALPEEDEFESHEQVAKLIGRPIAVTRGDTLTRFNVHIQEGMGVLVRGFYERSDGTTYNIDQDLINPSVSWGTVASAAGKMRVVQHDNGMLFYLSTMDDGTVFGETFGDDYHIHVASIDMTLLELQNVIMGIEFIEPGGEG